MLTLLLQETLPTKRGHQDRGLVVGKRLTRAFSRKPQTSIRRRSFVDGEATAPLLPSKTLHSKAGQEYSSPGMKEVFTRQTVINLAAYSFLAFHAVAFDQTLSVFLAHPVEKRTPGNFQPPFYFTGGFGLSIGQIGAILTIYGVVCGVIQFVLYSPLVTRYGVLRCFRICCKFNS